MAIASYFAIAFGLIAIGWNIFTHRFPGGEARRKRDAIGALVERVTVLETQDKVTCTALGCLPNMKIKIERLDQRMEDYMRELDRALNQSLRDWPTHIERDLLMDKLEHGHLSLAEVQRLDRLLVEDMLASTDANRKFRMGMTRARLTWIKSRLEDCHAK